MGTLANSEDQDKIQYYGSVLFAKTKKFSRTDIHNI